MKYAIALDIDGTIISQGSALPGAIEVVNKLKAEGFELQFLTNMTGRSPNSISKVLKGLGISAEPEEVHTSVSSCLTLLRNLNLPRCYLALPEATQGLFTEISTDEDSPEYVVLGDLDLGFNTSILNKILGFLDNGAQLISFHKNLYINREDTRVLDSGAFTNILELVSGKEAIITGKPSSIFFDGALSRFSTSPENTIFVGDDLTTDIHGANRAGSVSVLVKSGKFRDSDLKVNNPKPKYVISSLNELMEIDLIEMR